ncbi:uncharacterized protein HfgLR_01360 [Haloferax gibbonsii]|uniref:HNH nuclease domain-containing protein n=1 Tax=Haloferax gibbonsii TaxID=35746 RepID=A0A871BC37_HALGI|nr:HNH endonuclease [Haloferax gibbonsii]QOS10425.1 uncharacterized protein HfgLR_01360 [Haloferax gibbonsii]
MGKLSPSDIVHGKITRISKSGNGILDYGTGEISLGPILEEAVGTEVDAVVYDENHAFCLTGAVRTEYYDNAMRAQTRQLIDSPPDECPGIGDTVEVEIGSINSAGHGYASYLGIPIRVKNVPQGTQIGQIISVKVLRIEPSRLVATGTAVSLRGRLPEVGESFRAPISHKTHSGNGIIESFIGHQINVGPVRDEVLGDHVEAVLLDDQFAYCLSTNATIDGYRNIWEPKVTEIALDRSKELQQQLGRNDKPERSTSGRIVRPVQRRNSSFSKRVHRAYDHTCAVCGQRWKDDSGYFEVEAAHIYPVSGVSEEDPLEGGPDSVQNGMSLCRTHHWAFDHGWFTINDDYTISVKDDPSLEGYEAMAPYEGQQLYLPDDQSLWPARHYITFHRDHVWTG